MIEQLTKHEFLCILVRPDKIQILGLDSKGDN